VIWWVRAFSAACVDLTRAFPFPDFGCRTGSFRGRD
jgi:hypothetical protein